VTAARATLLAVALLSAAGAAAEIAATSAPPEDLAALLEPIRDRHHLPALAAAVLRGGRLAGLGATGVRRNGSDARVGAEDPWHLGSCTKAMTATLAARLVERGALGWDTRVGDALPALAPRIDPGFRGATLRELLSHRGGAPGDLLRLPIWSWLWNARVPTAEARARLVADVLSRPPEAPTGTRFLYSNAGYVIAASMLEAAAGEPWESLIQRELFAPLGMASAGFGAPERAGDVDPPWGHAVEGRGVRPVEPGPKADNPPALAPAGAVHASLRDWSRFVALHLAGARGEPTLLSPASFRTLQTPAGERGYALGWFVAERGWAGGATLSHVGSNTFWVADVWIAPTRDAAFLAVTNQGGPAAEKAADEAVSALIARFLAPAPFGS
jgi:CubicO group peptidase (beta-lactamase class C family)